jgi:hypothetical protein
MYPEKTVFNIFLYKLRFTKKISKTLLFSYGSIAAREELFFLKPWLGFSHCQLYKVQCDDPS